MKHNPENKKYEYCYNDIAPSVVNDFVAPYGVAVAHNVERHTLDDAKAFINKRFRELYQVSYDAI